MKNVFFVAFCCLTCSVFSQYESDTIDIIEKTVSTVGDDYAPIENWTFKTAPKVYKVTPFDIFSIIPTFGLDAEMRLPKGKYSAQVGLAVIPNMFQIISGESFDDYDRMGGYRLRGQFRAYLPGRLGRYIGAGISFRHLVIKDVVSVGMEGVDNGFGQEDFAYFVKTPMRFHRFNTHLSFRIGRQIETKSRLVIDYYTGLDLRSINVQSNSEIPDGGSVPEQRGMWRLADNHKLAYPVPVIGIKIGFK